MIRALAILSLGVGASASCADDGGPRLDSAEPAAARAGATVTLHGRRLCAGDCATAAGNVQIGLTLPVITAPVISYEDTRAEIAVPVSAPIGPTEIVVTVNERASNAVAFEVLP